MLGRKGVSEYLPYFHLGFSQLNLVLIYIGGLGSDGFVWIYLHPVIMVISRIVNLPAE